MGFGIRVENLRKVLECVDSLPGNVQLNNVKLCTKLIQRSGSTIVPPVGKNCPKGIFEEAACITPDGIL